jgi:hypothetical protein
VAEPAGRTGPAAAATAGTGVPAGAGPVGGPAAGTGGLEVADGASDADDGVSERAAGETVETDVAVRPASTVE